MRRETRREIRREMNWTQQTTCRWGVAFLLVGALFLAARAEAGTYEIDPSHTSVNFKIRHMAVSWVRGRFTDVKGTLEYDENDPSKSSLTVTVKAASIDTDDEKRDKHLRSPDFFDVDQYPEITFVSSEIRVRTDDGTGKAVGTLTLHGVTKGVTLKIEDFTPEIQDPWGNQRRGASATLSLDRQDYGIVYNKALGTGDMTIGDDVHIQIEVELVAKGETPE